MTCSQKKSILYNNQLTGTISSEFGSLAKLQQL